MQAVLTGELWLIFMHVFNVLYAFLNYSQFLRHRVSHFCVFMYYLVVVWSLVTVHVDCLQILILILILILIPENLYAALYKQNSAKGA